MSSGDQDKYATLVEEYKKAKAEHSRLFHMLNEEENSYRFMKLWNRYGSRKQQLESRMKDILGILPSEVRDTLDSPNSN